jgi:hypothetical protein
VHEAPYVTFFAFAEGRIMKPGNRHSHVVAFLLLILVGSLIAIPQLNHDAFFLRHRLWLWLGYALLMAIVALYLGRAITDHGKYSVLIDDTNRMSLSLLQFALWSLLLFSTVAASLTINQVLGVANPWAIDIPSELLIASGVSLATLVAARVVESDAANMTPDQNVLAKNDWRDNQGNAIDPAQQNTSGLFHADPAAGSNAGSDFTNRGVMAARTEAATASFADLVTGVAINGVTKVDLARVQMLILTMVIIGTYAGQVWTNLVAASGDGTTVPGFAFPGMTPELVALLALSSVGYVGGKQLDIYHSRT